MEYEDFEVQLGPRSGDGFLARVLRSPAGQGETIVRLPERVDAERDLRLRAPSGVPPAQIGHQLFRCLFSGQVGDLFLQSLSSVGTQRGLRIRLRVNPREPELEPLHRTPWELLFREDTDDFLSLSRRTPIVRALDVARPASELPFKPPLRILAVISQDAAAGLLELEEELKQLKAALGQAAAMLEVLENPNARALREALDATPFHVLHYMGHGTFDSVNGEGALLLRNSDGKRETLSGRNLATKIKDVSSLRLVVLNACETALASGSPSHNPFAGVAAALLLGGVPAVVAMQSAIGDRHAIAFSTAFYRQLARGMPVDEAITEGRQAIHSLNPDAGSWAIPVLFLRTPTGELFSHAAPRRLKASTVGLAAGAGLVLVFAGSVPTLLDRLAPGQREVANGHLPTATPAQTPVPVAPREEESPPSQTSPSPKSAPRKGGTVRTVGVGEGSEGLRLEIAGSGSFPDSFDEAFRQQVGRVPAELLDGWTVRLTAGASRVEPVIQEGEVLQSCRLSVSCQLRGHGQSHELGSVGLARAQFNATSACSLAAADLAKSVIHKIAPYIQQEGSK